MESLDSLRARIDSIDKELHQLLIERSRVAERIAAAKGAGEALLRPGREARILRRLVSRHEGPLDPAVLVRIWREILAGNTAIQGPLRVALGAGLDAVDLRDLTRDHFGAQTPVRAEGTAEAALRAVEDKSATVAVLPWPKWADRDPWWPVLGRSNAESLGVVARLPCLAEDSRPPAAVVGRAPFEETGADRSLAMATAREASEDGVMRACEAAGLEPRACLGCYDGEAGRLWLLELEGYVATTDPRLAEASALFQSAGQVVGLGGYALPIETHPDHRR